MRDNADYYMRDERRIHLLRAAGGKFAQLRGDKGIRRECGQMVRVVISLWFERGYDIEREHGMELLWYSHN